MNKPFSILLAGLCTTGIFILAAIAFVYFEFLIEKFDLSWILFWLILFYIWLWIARSIYKFLHKGERK